MNEDTWYQFMLNADLETLEQFFKTNKFARDYSQNLHFWKDKYHHFGYPVIDEDQLVTWQDWRHAFIKMWDIKVFLDNAFGLLDGTRLFTTVTVHIKYKFNKYNKYNDQSLLKYFPSEFLAQVLDIGVINYNKRSFNCFYNADGGAGMIYYIVSNEDVYMEDAASGDMTIDKLKWCLLPTLYEFDWYDTKIIPDVF
ncbi:MAG TPA: hypothetical protein VLG50_05930 [Candidatus Saccharimonadales bacterium]|nr:hypothetical protein [Candidatus Saccharimonadales bacterium]